jgi:RNA polymerase-interacting CarD/CdnL/TRCF family regulator
MFSYLRARVRGASGQARAAVRLAVGDKVAYGAHGAGSIAAREERVVLGRRQEVIVLALTGGLSVALPVDRAQELVRPLADEAEMSRVQETLGADEALSPDPWLKRRRDSLAKLSGGGPAGLAEIIRDGARREGSLSAKGARLQLSPGERELFERARHLLAIEIALVRGIRPAEAAAWIDSQLVRSERPAEKQPSRL